MSLNQSLVEIIIHRNPKILANQKSCHFVSVYPRLREIRAKVWNKFNPQGSEKTLVHIFILLSRDNTVWRICFTVIVRLKFPSVNGAAQVTDINLRTLMFPWELPLGSAWYLSCVGLLYFQVVLALQASVKIIFLILDKMVFWILWPSDSLFKALLSFFFNPIGISIYFFLKSYVCNSMIVENLTSLTFPYLIINIADIHPPTHAFTLYYGLYSYYSFYICIHTYIQCRVDNPPKVHVFGLWKEAGVSRANLHRHRVNALTPPRMACGSNPKPSSCETTVLNTA